MGNFTASVEKWVTKSEDAMLTVAQIAIQDTVDNSQTLQREGGRMRLDSGFLRASGVGSLQGNPSGPSERPKDAGPDSIPYDADAVKATIINMKFGDTFYFGWTANYAPIRELYDGFLEGSLQNWSQYVNAAVDTVNQRIG